MKELMNLELLLLDIIQEYMGSVFFDKVFLFFTHLGDHGLIWIVIAIALTIYPKTRKIGITSLIGLFCGFLITNLWIKPWIGRIRPYNYRDIVLLIKEPSDYSFPSGHTTSSFAVAFVLLKEKISIKHVNISIVILILACLIAFSRLYLYVHFPTDILAAVIIGFISAKIAGIVPH